jgi:protein-S-isoprenylcysteine O-methyltransferase Ste14
VQSQKFSYSRFARRVRVPLGFVFAAIYLCLAQPTWLSLLMGGLVAVVGLWLRAAASGHVKKNAELTTTGPYAYTRNPLYLGSLIIAVGFAAASRDWWVAAVIVVFFFAIYLPVISSEEKFLAATFPTFAAYAQQVPRLLPRLRATSGRPVSFSRNLYLQHREYNAAIGSALILLALSLKLLFGIGMGAARSHKFLW